MRILDFPILGMKHFLLTNNETRVSLFVERKCFLPRVGKSWTRIRGAPCLRCGT